MRITKATTEKLINNILEQAELGQIELGDEALGKWKFYVQFSNSLKPNSKNDIAIHIPNKNQFVENFKNYLQTASVFYKDDQNYFCLNDEDFLQKLILDLFINATNCNINNFNKFIEERTEMLKNENALISKQVIGEYLGNNIIVDVQKNKSNLEAPYKFKIAFEKENEKYYLPNITFGTINDKAFIYCIQGTKEKQTNKLSKQMDRQFRKANKNVDMEDEILSQVSVSALVALTIFLAYQKQNGIKSLSAYNFMPIRYNSNLIAGMLKSKTSEEEQEFLEKHNKNQFNITNKFFNTIIRYAHHFGLEYEYDDIYEKLDIDSLKPLINEDNIINEIDENILKYIKNKQKTLNF